MTEITSSGLWSHEISWIGSSHFFAVSIFFDQGGTSSQRVSTRDLIGGVLVDYDGMGDQYDITSNALRAVLITSVVLVHTMLIIASGGPAPLCSDFLSCLSAWCFVTWTCRWFYGRFPVCPAITQCLFPLASERVRWNPSLPCCIEIVCII
jgi:hypothetical protein